MKTSAAGDCRTESRRTGVRRILLISGLLSLMLLSFGLSAIWDASTSEPSQCTDNSPGAASQLRFYFKKAQWRADASTLAAMAQYFWAAEEQVAPAGGNPQFEVAMPTNRTSAVPKA